MIDDSQVLPRGPGEGPGLQGPDGAQQGPPERPPRTHGLRFAPWDPLVLLGGGLGWAWARPDYGDYALLVPFVVGHFFLFCNVFRLRPWRELVWAVALPLQVLAQTQILGLPSAASLMVAQLPLSLVLILGELRSLGYRGVGSRGPALEGGDGPRA